MCEVQIFAKFVRCYGLTDFNSTVTLVLSFQLSNCSICVTVPYLVICLTYVSLQVLQKSNISALLPDPKIHLSDHISTMSIAEANIEVLKAVAEAKEPQKRYFLRHVSTAVVPLHIATAKGSITPALKRGVATRD